jgi:hypothetical protein
MACQNPSPCKPQCSPPQLNFYNLTDNPEHCLFEQMVQESCDITGFPIEYRKLLNDNEQLFGEDPNANLSEPILTKAMFEPSDETSILDMFGITGDDTMEIVNIPINTFTRDCSASFNNIDPDLKVIPVVGDVIKILYSNRNYEITNISKENIIFLAKKFVYTLILRPYRYSEQSDEHRDVYNGLPDDPFETIVQTPSGNDVMQKNDFSSNYSDDTWIEDESEFIDDYPDVDTKIFGY